MFERRGSRAKDVSAEIRAKVPAVAEAEADLGSRLVIARNVIRMRIQRGYTQKQLAAELGISQPRVAEIEAGRANLQVDTLDRIARVFGVESARLLTTDKMVRSRGLVTKPIETPPRTRSAATAAWSASDVSFSRATSRVIATSAAQEVSKDG